MYHFIWVFEREKGRGKYILIGKKSANGCQFTNFTNFSQPPNSAIWYVICNYIMYTTEVIQKSLPHCKCEHTIVGDTLTYSTLRIFVYVLLILYCIKYIIIKNKNNASNGV